MMPVELLYEDSELFVAVKPPGMPSQPERSPAMDMVSYLKNLLASRDGIKNPYVGVVHRLDRPVGGVMVYAKTPRAAAELSAQIASRAVRKEYLAVVHGAMAAPEGTLTHWLVKDGRTNRSRIVTPTEDGALPKDARKAVLDYQALETAVCNGQTYTLLRIRLHTGRHHQIRVQLAGAGHPLAGDGRYRDAGSGDGFCELGLFSCRLEFVHPRSKKTMSWEARPQAAPFGMFCKKS